MATVVNALVVFLLAYIALVSPAFFASRTMNRSMETVKRNVALVFSLLLAAASVQYPAPFSSPDFTQRAAITVLIGCYAAILTTAAKRAARNEYDFRIKVAYLAQIVVVVLAGAVYAAL